MSVSGSAFRTEAFETLDSTQDEMHRRLAKGEEVSGLVVRAARQTKGRGRRGRDWASAAGGSYQTLALRDPQPPLYRRPHTALVMAVGLATTFRGYGLRAYVKWPNDLYYREHKIAGILTDYAHYHLVIGVGVNVDNPVPEGAAGLRGWALGAVHAAVLEGLQEGLRLLASTPVTALPELFDSFDLLKNASVTAVSSSESFEAVARGITEEGCLKLERRDGSITPFCSGRLERFTLAPSP
jgi:BirA family biotin operon repressor/biotin-[acetyl-CoA-carboxylase] ligase